MRRRIPSFWTPEKDQELAAMLQAGLSAWAIARQLGNGLTKNAIIGRSHRVPWIMALRNKRRPMQTESAPKAPRPKPIARAPEPIEPVEALPFVPPEPSAPQAIPEAPTGLISIMDLTEHTCRWPVGEVLSPEFGYCGVWKNTAGPYCIEHSKRAKSTAAELRELREQAMGV